MIDFVEPPKLWIPERPAIIRPGIDIARYFPVDLDRHARRAIVSELIKSGRVEKGAIPFGMFSKAPSSNNSLISILTTLGLTSGLKAALDAGDASSWPGSGQTWLDTSGTGSNFYLGTSSGTDSADPTFNGTVGGLSSSEYWSFDGADYFTVVGGNPAWVNTMHKKSAKVAWASWVRPASVNLQTIFANLNNNLGAGIGFAAYLRAEGTFRVRVRGNSATAKEITTSATYTANNWLFVSGRIDESESSNGASVGLNDTFEDFSSTYATPSTSDAAIPLTIGSCGTNEPIENNGRMAQQAFWTETIPSKADLLSLFNATKGRFGL